MSESQQQHPIDEKLYGSMTDFIHRTVSLRRAFVLYGRDNAMCAENLAHWRAAAALLFKDRGIIEITIAGNKLFFGDSLLGAESPFVRELIENLRRLIIRRISLQRVIDDREIYLLLEMLSSESRALLIKGGPVAFLREGGAKSISVVENIYLKRVGQTGEIVLDEGKLGIEDLHFIRRQLSNIITLARGGFELGEEERGLLSEVVQHPTFVGELIREMTDAEPGAPEPEAVVQAEGMSDIFEILATELRKGGRCSPIFLSDSFSSALMAMDEPTRLEVLCAQFKTAGQLPPMLSEEVFACTPNHVANFILDMHQRDEREPRRVSTLLRRLAPSDEALKRIFSHLKPAAIERGIDRVTLEKLTKEVTELSAPARAPSPVRKGVQFTGMPQVVEKLEKISLPPGGLKAYLNKGDDRREEILVLSELLGGGTVTPKLIRTAAARIRDLVKNDSIGEACGLFSALFTPAASADRALADAARGEVKSLCGDGALHSILLAPLPLDDRGLLIAGVVKSLAPGDAGRVWEQLVSNRDGRIHDALIDAGRRESHGVAELVRLQIAGGRPDLLARGVDILSALPAELSAPILMDLCGHPEPGVRLKAVTLLGKGGVRRAVPLVRVLAGDRDREVRHTAIPVLAHLGGEAAVDRLLEIVEDSSKQWDVEDKVLACRALAKSGGERAVPMLAKLLRETHGRRSARSLYLLRASARFALESIGGPRAQDALREDSPQGVSLLRRFFGGRC